MAPPPPAPPDTPAPPPEHRRGPLSLAASPDEARGLMAFRPFAMNVLRRCRVPDRDVPDVAQNILLQLLPWWKGRCQLGAPQEDAPAGTGRAYDAHAVVGATVAQIAEAEGVAISSIYARMHVARRDLRAALRRSRAANPTR